MDSCLKSFASQLLSGLAMEGGVTSMEQFQLSSILSLLPEDDSLSCIPELLGSVQAVAKGSEGALITIEEI